jgi:hypothetical protein
MLSSFARTGPEMRAFSRAHRKRIPGDARRFGLRAKANFIFGVAPDKVP